jgi:CHAT domain-containing protein/tetratricopeptide (TPR) repeat protein
MAMRSADLTDRFVDDLLASDDFKGLLRENGWPLDASSVANLKLTVDRLAAVDFKKASRLAAVIWELSKHIGDDLSQAYAEAALGRVASCLGHYTQAIEHYQKATLLMSMLGQRVEVAILQKQQVGVLMHLDRTGEAISLAAQACRALKAHREDIQLAELEINIGNLYGYSLDQYHKALRHYERAKIIFTRLQKEIDIARLEYNIANVLTNLDRVDEALELYERALQTFQKHGMDIFAGQASYNIAYLLFRRGQFNEALKYYYRVRDTQKTLGNNVSVAWCNLDLAEIYLQLSVFEESARFASMARASFLEFDNIFKASRAQMINGLALAGLGQFDDARKELAAALEVFARINNRVIVGLIHTYLAEIELNASNYQAALAHAHQAERIFVREHLSAKAVFAQFLLARLAYLTGEPRRAQIILQNVLWKAQLFNLTWIEYECHYLRGLLYESAFKPSQALAEYAITIDYTFRIQQCLCTDELKSAYLEDKMDLFERAISLALEIFPDCAQALNYVEQAKSRSLVELLAHYSERELAEQVLQPELKSRFRSLLNEMRWYNSLNQSGYIEEESARKSYIESVALKKKKLICEQELAEMFRRIQIESRSYADLKQPASLDLSALQQQLPANELLIEYFSTQEQISAFIISKDSVIIKRQLVSKTKINELLDSFQFQIGKFVNVDYVNKHLAYLNKTIKEYLKKLYLYLIEPFAEALKDKALTIVPHGLLHYIPFHALFDGNNFLIENHDISYAPSITVYLLCLKKAAIRTGPLLILGLPDNAAPAIMREVNEIKDIFPHTQVLIEKDASLENLKRYGPDCRILHLATHGVMRPDNPLFSYLKLADRELTFYNTFDLKLKAELVTLSACHTGINRVFPGDELHGLMRGFLYAGVPSMLASLWEVSDRATCELMVGFYQRLCGGASKRTALCQAQRELLQQWQHPYYWAAFSLIGKP